MQALHERNTKWHPRDPWNAEAWGRGSSQGGMLPQNPGVSWGRSEPSQTACWARGEACGGAADENINAPRTLRPQKDSCLILEAGGTE